MVLLNQWKKLQVMEYPLKQEQHDLPSMPKNLMALPKTRLHTRHLVLIASWLKYL